MATIRFGVPVQANALQIALVASAVEAKCNISVEIDVVTASCALPDYSAVLEEPSAICRYLSAKTALASSSLDTDKILDQNESSILPAVEQWAVYAETPGKVAGPVQLRNVFRELEALLGSKKYLGDSLSIADVCVWASLYPVLAKGGLATNGKDFPSVSKWFGSIASLPWVKKGLGSIKVKSPKDIKFSAPSYQFVNKQFDTQTGRSAAPVVGTEASAAPAAPAAEEEEAVEDASENDYNAQGDVVWSPGVPVGHTVFSWKRKFGNEASSDEDEKIELPERGPAPYLPKKGGRNILVTSALPYVNNVPHLGNIIGCVLSADVYARFCRLRGHNVIYMCGTDEYGTATETKAIEMGLTPQQICDKYHKIHKSIYEWFDIQFDHFGRTTTGQQTEIAQDIFWKCENNGMCEEKETVQLYCEKYGFLADRFVEGECPKCQYPDARGDQCDGCGSLLNSTELINPRAKLDKTVPVTEKSSNHIFLDLPQLEPRLREFVAKSSVKGAWTKNSIDTTNSWLKMGLKPRCITRDLKWGTPVPKKGFEKKVFYVWFDAPIGYLSITANYTKDWEKWWKNPDDVELVQFMGKDNVPFHTVIFPCTLLGANDNYTMLHHISTTEYLNYENGQFSKSRNVGVFGDDAKSTGIPPEVWRYYLLANRPEGGDTQFEWRELCLRNNSELLNNLGNFINRALSFCKTKFGTVPAAADKLNKADEVFLAEKQTLLAKYVDQLEKYQIRDALRTVMAMSALGNRYLQEEQPWVSFKGDKARCGTVVNLAVNLVYLLAGMSEPYMPSLTKKVEKQLNCSWKFGMLSRSEDGSFPFKIKAGHELGNPAPLFKRIDNADELKARFAGEHGKQAVVQGPSFPLDLRLGVIKKAEAHPKTVTLFVLTIDVGEDKTRQIVASFKKHYELSDLPGKTVVVLCNVQASKFKGVDSEGQLLIGTKAKLFGVLTAAGPVGTQVVPKGAVLEIKDKFNYKKEFGRLQLKTVQDGQVVFEKMPLEAEGKAVTAERVGKGGRIK